VILPLHDREPTHRQMIRIVGEGEFVCYYICFVSSLVVPMTGCIHFFAHVKILSTTDKGFGGIFVIPPGKYQDSSYFIIH
jgi:hypothetical protein